MSVHDSVLSSDRFRSASCPGSLPYAPRGPFIYPPPRRSSGLSARRLWFGGEAIEQYRCRLLLGAALGWGGCGGGRTPGPTWCSIEKRRVIRPACRDEVIRGKSQPARLNPFLQRSLRVTRRLLHLINHRPP